LQELIIDIIIRGKINFIVAFFPLIGLWLHHYTKLKYRKLIVFACITLLAPFLFGFHYHFRAQLLFAFVALMGLSYGYTYMLEGIDSWRRKKINTGLITIFLFLLFGSIALANHIAGNEVIIKTWDTSEFKIEHTLERGFAGPPLDKYLLSKKTIIPFLLKTIELSSELDQFNSSTIVFKNSKMKFDSDKGVFANFHDEQDSDLAIPKGYSLVSNITGDLNDDGLVDHVFLIKGRSKQKFDVNRAGELVDRNRRGIIIYVSNRGSYTLSSKNLDCFSSENEDGGIYVPPELSLEIIEGKLSIDYSHGRYGTKNYRFRCHNHDFILTSYESSDQSGPIINHQTSISFDGKIKITKENVNQNAIESGEENFKETITPIGVSKLFSLNDIDDFDSFEIENCYYQLSEEEAKLVKIFSYEQKTSLDKIDENIQHKYLDESWRTVIAKSKKVGCKIKSIDGQYIPMDLKDSHAVLDTMLHDSIKLQIANGAESHFGLGMYLRNNWGLWTGSRLKCYFKEQGFVHPDHMSGMILHTYYMKLNNKQINEDSTYTEAFKSMKEFQEKLK